MPNNPVTYPRRRYVVHVIRGGVKSVSAPYDYRGNAISERIACFASDKKITRCWIERDGVVIGKVLERGA